jgi:hypothetical protein
MKYRTTYLRKAKGMTIGQTNERDIKEIWRKEEMKLKVRNV